MACALVSHHQHSLCPKWIEISSSSNRHLRAMAKSDRTFSISLVVLLLLSSPHDIKRIGRSINHRLLIPYTRTEHRIWIWADQQQASRFSHISSSLTDLKWSQPIPAEQKPLKSTTKLFSFTAQAAVATFSAHWLSSEPPIECRLLSL